MAYFRDVILSLCLLLTAAAVDSRQMTSLQACGGGFTTMTQVR
jgi:hypothetical protein